MKKTKNNGIQPSSSRKARAMSLPTWGWTMPTSGSHGRNWDFTSISCLTDRKLKQREIAELLGDQAAGSLAPDERALQPLHHRQAAGFPQAAGPEGDDPDQLAQAGRAVSGNMVRRVMRRGKKVQR